MATLTATACAHSPPPPAHNHEHEENGRYALAKLLTDACTDEETTPARIAIVDFVLRTCHMIPAACLRLACKSLDEQRPPFRAELRP